MKTLNFSEYIKGCKYYFATYLISAFILSLGVFIPSFFHSVAIANLINLWLAASMFFAFLVIFIFNKKKNNFNKISQILIKSGALETLQKMRFNVGLRSNNWENYFLISGYFREYTIQIELEKEGSSRRFTFVVFVDPMRSTKKIKGDGFVKALKFYPDQIHFKSKLRIPTKYDLAENLKNTLNDFIDFLEENKVKPH
jgi:hypothetical protein